MIDHVEHRLERLTYVGLANFEADLLELCKKHRVRLTVGDGQVPRVYVALDETPGFDTDDFRNGDE